MTRHPNPQLVWLHQPWTREQASEDRLNVYLYGDNYCKRGGDSMAMCRDLSNAIGVPIKRYPGMDPGAMFTDADYDLATTQIKSGLDKAFALARARGGNVLCYRHIGKGHVKLDETAPRIYEFLWRELDGRFEI